MTVARLRVEMDSDELTRWHAFDAWEARRRDEEAAYDEDRQRTGAALAAAEAARAETED